MMIKIGDDYLDFNGDVEMERQVMNVDNFDNVGDFSYSFTVNDTSHNRKLLGVTSIDEKDKRIFTVSDNTELQTDGGITIHRGSILVTDTKNLECSFVSGNTNFFNSIAGNINDIDFSEYDVLLSESAIVDSWTSTEGVVFPLVDRGALSNRKDPFLKLRVRRGRLDLNDFQPFIYIKDVIKKTLTWAGLKITGDLVNDMTYKNLITTNNNRGFYDDRFKENSVYVGKTATQTITDASFTKISFEDLTSVQFFNSAESPFDLSNDRWTVAFDSLINIKWSMNVSDNTKLINFELRRNGTDILDSFQKGLNLQFEIYDGLNYEHATPGDYYELWATVDPSTPGSVDITAGTFLGEIISTSMIFANALLPDQESTEFIRDIFKMFNVVCTFDNYTKTINTRFFKNIKLQAEQDLSEYFVAVENENGFELVSDYAKRSVLSYAQDDTPEVSKYNNENTVEYGNGELVINNKFIENRSDLYGVNFTATFSQYYPAYGLQLLKLNFVEYIIPDGNETTVTSVANSGGLAYFNSTTTLTNNLYISDADANMALLQMSEIESDAQIIAVNVPNMDLPIDVRFTFDDASSLPTGTEGFPIRIYDSTVPAYNGDWENALFISTPRSTASVAYFMKYSDGTDMDTYKQGLAFGEIPGKDSQSLIQGYYIEFEGVLNDPVKPIITMLIPEHVYFNLDFLKPVRIKTEKFNSLFFLQKITGYKNSYTPCSFELIKI